jgi:hypothetical protein
MSEGTLFIRGAYSCCGGGHWPWIHLLGKQLKIGVFVHKTRGLGCVAHAFRSTMMKAQEGKGKACEPVTMGSQKNHSPMWHASVCMSSSDPSQVPDIHRVELNDIDEGCGDEWAT